MHALDQFTGGKLIEGATECGLAGQYETQINATRSAQLVVRLQTLDQCAGGL
jgi:hypothetical protein